MKNTVAVLLFVLTSLLIISCQKEISPDIISQTGGNSGGNGNTASYLPTIIGT